MPQPKRSNRYYAIKTADRTAEVQIYGQIRQSSFWDEYFGGSEYTSAKSFRRELTEAVKNADRVVIRINSQGGDISEGNAIITAIKNCGKPTSAIVEGIAYSMGAVIALACDETWMPRNTLLMLHAPSTYGYGTAHDFRTTAAVLDKYAVTLAETISDRTKETPEQAIAKYMDNEDHYFTAREAMDAQLITGIKEYDSDSLPAVDDVRDGEKISAWFEANPVLAEDKNKSRGWIERAAALLSSKPKNETFNLKTLQSILAAYKAGEPLTLTAEQLTAVNAEINTATNGGKFLHTADELKAVQDQLTAVNGTVDTQKTTITNLQTEVTDLKKQLGNTEAENHNEAVKTGTDKVDNTSVDSLEPFLTSWDREKRAQRAQDKIK